MLKIEIDGFEQFEKTLKDLRENAERLAGEHSVPLGDLFPPEWMCRYTPYGSFDAFLQAGGFQIESEEHFEEITERDLDPHVKATTRWATWLEMQDAAVDDWARRQLGA